VEYAYANRSEYDAIFIIQAGDTQELAELFSAIAASLGFDTNWRNQQVSINVVLGWLSNPVRLIIESKPPEEDTTPLWLL
jgi:hypothetical protein